MKKLLSLILPLAGIPTIYSSQTMQSTSSASTAIVSSSSSDTRESVSTQVAPTLTAAQSIAILQNKKFDSDLVVALVNAEFGKNTHDFFQKTMDHYGESTALKFLYIKQHLLELTPSTMPFNCIPVLHRALKESYIALDRKKWRQAEIVFDFDNDESPNSRNPSYRIKELCDSPGISEGSNKVIIQRLTAQQFATNYFYTPKYFQKLTMPSRLYLDSPSIQQLSSDKHKKNHKDDFLGTFLPTFAESHSGWVSLIWIHPTKTKQLLECSMEQLEFMVDLYHTQDPRIQKNPQRAIIFSCGSKNERIFQSLPPTLQKNLKLNYPIVPTSLDRFFHNACSFYRAHKVKILFMAGTLAAFGSLFAYYKWIQKTVHKRLS